MVSIAAPIEGSEDIVTKEAELAEAALEGRDEPKNGDFIIAPIQLVNPTLGYGMIGERDSRDNQIAARQGSFFELNWIVANEAVGSDINFQSIKSSYNLCR